MGEAEIKTRVWQFEAFRLLGLDNNRNGLSTADIERHLKSDFGLSDRAVRAGLVQMEKAGLIRSELEGRKHKWLLHPTANLRASSLDEETALALVLTESLLQDLLPETTRRAMRSFFAAAHAKLKQKPNTHGRWKDKVRVLSGWQALVPPEFAAEVRDEILACLLADERCALIYRHSDEHTARPEIVCPLALVQRGTVLYLIARPGQAVDELPQFYPLHRIQRATRRYESFERGDFDLDAFLASGAEGFRTGAERIELTLAFTPEAGRHLFDTPLATGQRIARSSDGSRLLVQAEVPLTPQLRWWIQAFGDAVEVLGPPSLRQEMAATLRAAAQRYHPPRVLMSTDFDATPDAPADDLGDTLRDLDEALRLAFERTDYCVDGPEPLSFRINQASPEVDRLLMGAGVRHAAFLTAFNPHGQWRERRLNLAAQDDLLSALREARIATVPGRGCDPDGQWAAEESVLALGMNAKTALAWGQRLQQAAVVVLTLGQPPRLLFTQPEGNAA